MFSSQNIKYIFLFGILSWVILPVLDVLGVPSDNKINEIFGLSSAFFAFGVLGLGIYMVFEGYGDKDDRRRFFMFMFGKMHYNFIFTFSLIPCIIYAVCYEYYDYAGWGLEVFLILEYIRTKQNEYAYLYAMMKVKEL